MTVQNSRLTDDFVFVLSTNSIPFLEILDS